MQTWNDGLAGVSATACGTAVGRLSDKRRLANFDDASVIHGGKAIWPSESPSSARPSTKVLAQHAGF